MRENWCALLPAVISISIAELNGLYLYVLLEPKSTLGVEIRFKTSLRKPNIRRLLFKGVDSCDCGAGVPSLKSIGYPVRKCSLKLSGRN